MILANLALPNGNDYVVSPGVGAKGGLFFMETRGPTARDAA